MASRHYSKIQAAYCREAVHDCSLFVMLPMGVQFVIAEFLPRSLLLKAVKNPHRPRAVHDGVSRRAEINTAYLIQHFLRHPWIVDGSNPDLFLWEQIWKDPCGDQTFIIDYSVSRKTCVERHMTSGWDVFLGSISSEKQEWVRHYKKPDYWSVDTLDSIISKFISRKDSFDRWGYADY